MPDLDEETATHLDRIVPEAVSNAVEHANAEEIVVVLESSSDDTLTLTVQDDGAGDAPSGGEGLGMRTMRYRSDLIGGSMFVEEAADGGTLVGCRLPVRGT